MNLVLDIGNTHIKSGVFDAKTLVKSEQIEMTHLPTFLACHTPHHIMVSDVRGVVENRFKSLSKKYNFVLLNHHLKLPIKNAYKTPHTLGFDRIAAVVGAYASQPHQNHLVIDAGTCLTYDFIDRSGKYWGGSISMGLNMRFQALAHFTGKLPEINTFDYFSPLVGQTTEESMISGVIHGLLGEIEYLLNEYRKKFTDFKVTICGGDAVFFEKRIKEPIFVNQKLVLFGLNEILQYNLEKEWI